MERGKEIEKKKKSVAVPYAKHRGAAVGKEQGSRSRPRKGTRALAFERAIPAYTGSVQYLYTNGETRLVKS